MSSFMPSEENRVDLDMDSLSPPTPQSPPSPSSISSSRAMLPNFEDSDFYVNPDSVNLGPPIGEGAFSTVFVGRYFGDIVAVKKQTRQGKDLEKYLLRELAVLKYIRHENMLEYIGAYNVIAKSRGQLHAVYIITEYAAGGDLMKLLRRLDTPLGWSFRIRIAQEGALALEYLHSQSLIHRDIKSSNFLLDADWRCKLSDFGMAREVSSSGKMTICGTDEYMAPEMLFDEDFSYPADMFSFGMVLLEILTRQKVGDEGFARRTPAKLFALEEKDVLELIPSDAPSSLVNLATQCLGYEPDDRPSATTAKEWLLDLLSELPPDKCPIPNIMEAPHVPDPVEEEDSAPAPNERNAPVTRHDSGIVRKSSLSNWGMAQSAASGHGKVASRKGSLQRLASFARRGSFSPTQLSGSGVINLGDTTGTATANLLSDTGSPIPSKMGYLHIKNQGLGFRNWKKRWFVLKGSELTCYKENGLIESVDLTGCTIVRGKANRFQIVRLDVREEGRLSLHGSDVMELSSPNTSGLEPWLSSIQGAIDYANDLSRYHDEARSFLDDTLGMSEEALEAIAAHAVATDGEGQEPDVASWLEVRGVGQLGPAFEKAGFTDVERLRRRGLSPVDLQKIEFPLRGQAIMRRYLENLGRSPFLTHLRVNITGHRAFGDVIIFKVVSEWRAWHCKTEKLWTDFNKLHNRLKREMREASSPLCDALPELPGKGKVIQNQKDPSFILQRKLSLERYLQDITALVGRQEPFFTTLCDMLDLAPGHSEAEKQIT